MVILSRCVQKYFFIKRYTLRYALDFVCLYFDGSPWIKMWRGFISRFKMWKGKMCVCVCSCSHVDRRCVCFGLNFISLWDSHAFFVFDQFRNFWIPQIYITSCLCSYLLHLYDESQKYNLGRKYVYQKNPVKIPNM